MVILFCRASGDGVMAGTSTAVRSGVRWAMRYSKWAPTQEEWTLASCCVQPEEKNRIGRFVFKKDSKSAMVSTMNVSINGDILLEK